MKVTLALNGTKAEGPSPNNRRVFCRIDSVGKASLVAADKFRVASSLRIPFRDLRILDPQIPTPYPTAIFIREEAIVLNLESIKAIVARDSVWLLSVRDVSSGRTVQPLPSSPLVRELCSRLAEPSYASGQAAVSESQSGLDDSQGLKAPSPAATGAGLPSVAPPAGPPSGAGHGLGQAHAEVLLPYELRALEVLLTEHLKILELDVSVLESDTADALSAMTRKVSRAALEAVRTAKMRLTRLADRVSRTRDEIGSILDDESEMMDLNLTRRHELDELLAEVSTSYGSDSGSDGDARSDRFGPPGAGPGWAHTAQGRAFEGQGSGGAALGGSPGVSPLSGRRGGGGNEASRSSRQGSREDRLGLLASRAGAARSGLGQAPGISLVPRMGEAGRQGPGRPSRFSRSLTGPEGFGLGSAVLPGGAVSGGGIGPGMRGRGGSRARSGAGQLGSFPEEPSRGTPAQAVLIQSGPRPSRSRGDRVPNHSFDQGAGVFLYPAQRSRGGRPLVAVQLAPGAPDLDILAAARGRRGGTLGTLSRTGERSLSGLGVSRGHRSAGHGLSNMSGASGSKGGQAEVEGGAGDAGARPGQSTASSGSRPVAMERIREARAEGVDGRRHRRIMSDSVPQLSSVAGLDKSGGAAMRPRLQPPQAPEESEWARPGDSRLASRSQPGVFLATATSASSPDLAALEAADGPIPAAAPAIVGQQGRLLGPYGSGPSSPDDALAAPARVPSSAHSSPKMPSSVGGSVGGANDEQPLPGTGTGAAPEPSPPPFRYRPAGSGGGSPEDLDAASLLPRLGPEPDNGTETYPGVGASEGGLSDTVPRPQEAFSYPVGIGISEPSKPSLAPAPPRIRPVALSTLFESGSEISSPTQGAGRMPAGRGALRSARGRPGAFVGVPEGHERGEAPEAPAAGLPNFGMQLLRPSGSGGAYDPPTDLELNPVFGGGRGPTSGFPPLRVDAGGSLFDAPFGVRGPSDPYGRSDEQGPPEGLPVGSRGLWETEGPPRPTEGRKSGLFRRSRSSLTQRDLVDGYVDFGPEDAARPQTPPAEDWVDPGPSRSPGRGGGGGGGGGLTSLQEKMMSFRAKLDRAERAEKERGRGGVQDGGGGTPSRSSGRPRRSSIITGSTTSAFSDEIDATEAMLETCFLQADFLHRRLAVLRERVDDTESFVQVALDYTRNDIFLIEVLISGVTLFISIMTLISGIFGMNLNSTIQESIVAFGLVVVLGFLFIIVACAGFVIFLQRRYGVFTTHGYIQPPPIRSLR